MQIPMNDTEIRYRQRKTDGKRFSRPRIITLSVMLVCIAAAAVVLIVVGSFGYPVYTNTENTKVLLYHLVSDETYGPNEYLFVRVSDFESQLAAIKRLGYETVFADELSQTRGKKCVVLTFDDGYEDNFTNVLPLLEKYDMKATVFLISDMIGTEGHLSEDQIREMAASGRIHFGSHTKSHRKLYELEADEMELELVQSRRRIEELTGMKVSALAYPNGVCDAAAELAAAENGYLYCYTTDSPSESYYDNTRLPRSYVMRDTDMADFLKILE